jgi:NAD+ synthase
VLNGDGELPAQLASWREAYRLTEWTKSDKGWACEPGVVQPHPTGLEAIYQAMTVGLRDYVNKNGFPGVVLGLSGGIDSAISAAVAVDALGPDRVHCVMMPSPFTSKESLEDAELVAKYLGTRLDTVSIEPTMAAFGEALGELFAGTEPGITEENIQSRSRGLILMALSNKFGKMLLTTGNKSEMSVGYATLYGDMCGGYSVLKDVYKITAFALSEWRNENQPEGALGPDALVMPERVITKPPSAELKPDQKDEDSLPPYEVLDAILMALVEEEKSVEEIVARGYDVDTVRRVWRLLDRTEYKRRQAPPGVKLTFRAFGRDRRYPITNGFTKLI